MCGVKLFPFPVDVRGAHPRFMPSNMTPRFLGRQIPRFPHIFYKHGISRNVFEKRSVKINLFGCVGKKCVKPFFFFLHGLLGFFAFLLHLTSGLFLAPDSCLPAFLLWAKKRRTVHPPFVGKTPQRRKR